MTTVKAAFFSLLAALPATAEQIGTSVSSDLNGDGRAEQFALIDNEFGSVDLRIENTGTGTLLAQNIAWLGGIGQQPELGVAENGSVLLTSMNEAIGRHRWHMTLTIAHRRGTYLVAGFTYDWYDTIDLEDAGLCDLNLLNGRGTLRRGTGPDTPVRTDQPAMAATDWKDDTAIPDACGLAN